MIRLLERSLRVGLALAIVGLAGACAQPEPPDTRAQDEAAIRQIEKSWSSSINTRNIDAFMANYAPDAIGMAPNQPMASTPETLRKGISEMLALPGLDMTFQTGGVTVAKSGDVAYSYGTYSLGVTGPDGKPMTDKGKYVTTWKKQADGAWKATLDIFNSDMPAMAPPAPDKKK